MKNKNRVLEMPLINGKPKTVFMNVLQRIDSDHEFFKMNLGFLYAIAGVTGCGNTYLAQKMCLAKMQHDVQTKIRIVDTDDAYEAFTKSTHGEYVVVDSYSDFASHNRYGDKIVAFNLGNFNSYSEELTKRLIDIIRTIKNEMSATEGKYVVVIDNTGRLPPSPLGKIFNQAVKELLMVAKNTQSKIIIVTYNQDLRSYEIPEYYNEVVVCKYSDHPMMYRYR